MADDWTIQGDVTDLDFYSDIQAKIPGIQATSGFRTKAYQEDMKRRGYHPADDSGHLLGEKLDLLPPKGKDNAWLKNEVLRHYPYAQILDEEDHLDVRFPGYRGAPALGGAAKAGITNPNRVETPAPAQPQSEPTKQDDWVIDADVTDILPPKGVEFEGGHQAGEDTIGVNNPETQAAIIGLDTAIRQGKTMEDIARDHPEWMKHVKNPAELQAAIDYHSKVPASNPQFDYEKTEPDIVVNGQQKPAESVPHAMAASALDTAQGVQEGLNRTSDNIVQYGAKLADALGITDGSEEDIRRLRDDLTDRDNSAYVHPDGWSRTAGDFIGEGLAMAPLNEVRPFAEAGKLGQMADLAVQGGAAGALTSPDNPGAGAAVGAGVGAGLSPVFDLAGAAAKRLGRDVSTIKPEDITPEDVVNVRHGRSNKTVKQHTNDVAETVRDTVKGWKNAPDIEVVESIDQIKNKKVRDDFIQNGGDDAQGALGADGKVYIIAGMHDSPADAVATVYHESLGHKGLTNVFGQRLDDELIRLYDNTPSFQKAVDDWMEQYKTNSIPRAADEVLAEMSQDGRITQGMMAKLKVAVRQFGRKLGVVKDFSDDEIVAILRRAHDSVIDTGPTGAGANGTQFMRKTQRGTLNKVDVARAEKAAKEAPQREGKAGNLNLNRVDSQLDIKPLQAEIAKTFPKQTMTHEEMSAKANALKEMTPEEIHQVREVLENIQPYVIKTRDEAARAGTRRARISAAIERAKAQGRPVSKRLIDGYAEALTKEHALLEDAQSIASSAGRLLNSYKLIAEGSDVGDHVRFSMKPKDLFDHVDNAGLPETDALDVKADLTKLLGGGKMTKAEMTNLKRVFPTKTLKHILDPRTRGQKVHDFSVNALSLPRSIMSSMDLSAPFRQGLFLINRKEFWTSFYKMFHYMGSEKAFKALSADIRSRPTFKLMESAGLDFTNVSAKLTAREEAFMSNWADKIPVIGRGVRASERAYLGFLNKLRADTFDSLVGSAKKAGIDFMDDPKSLRDIAKFVNTATGRGELGSLKGAGPILNSLFFSPRLMASRFNLLNPKFYIDLSPIARREALKSLLSLSGIALTVTGLAKMGGLSVDYDPRSSDFAKIRTGNTRYDILGGFGQYITLGARLLTNEKKMARGKIQELGDKFGTDTRLDVTEKFFENKLSPIAGFVADYLRGKDPVGKEFDVSTAVLSRFVPMIINDMVDIIKEDGWESIGKVAPSVFGVGVSTYDENKPKERKQPAEDKWEIAK